MSIKTFSIETFKISNIPKDKKAECTTSKLSVTVIGLKDDIEKLTSNQIMAQIDISNIPENLGHTEVPVDIIINGNYACWAYGNYTADILISSVQDNNSSAIEN